MKKEKGIRRSEETGQQKIDKRKKKRGEGVGGEGIKSIQTNLSFALFN